MTREKFQLKQIDTLRIDKHCHIDTTRNALLTQTEYP